VSPTADDVYSTLTPVAETSFPEAKFVDHE
jgi:hypothetical protein